MSGRFHTICHTTNRWATAANTHHMMRLCRAGPIDVAYVFIPRSITYDPGGEARREGRSIVAPVRWGVGS